MESIIKLKIFIYLNHKKRISNDIYQQLNIISSILFIEREICRKIIKEF